MTANKLPQIGKRYKLSYDIVGAVPRRSDITVKAGDIVLVKGFNYYGSDIKIDMSLGPKQFNIFIDENDAFDHELIDE